MIASIIGGAIIGALARFFMKGKQNIGIIVTIILGMCSSALTTCILDKVWPSANNTSGVDWIHLIISIVVATVLIGLYTKIFHSSEN